ncbi:MAG TPA: hypothetical protein ENN51_06400 [candidate division WOR-3 bacterium]|uniref:Uncharacterized protein n=1 Tax=candidate division WOR-3 bacterium TaxID=2052148 RepID=A0A7V0T6L0_UNCW3|nr:hypothetical protein [candidate division WOR-3 bacterium]
MSPAERANAVIDLEREEPLARDIEHLWNTGNYDRALELFPTLAPQEVGINWREPIPAPEADWGGAGRSLHPRLGAQGQARGR